MGSYLSHEVYGNGDSSFNIDYTQMNNCGGCSGRGSLGTGYDSGSGSGSNGMVDYSVM